MNADWRKIWSKRHSIRLSESWCYGAFGFEKTHGVPFPRQRIEIEDSFGTGYVDEKEYRLMLDHFVRRIKSVGFNDVLGTAEDEYRSFLEYAQTLSSQDLSACTQEELATIFDDFTRKEDHWMHFMWPVFALDEGLSPEFEKYAASLDEEARAKVESLVLVPEKETAAGLYHTNIIELLARNPSDQELEEGIARLADTYAYFPILNMDEETLSVESVRADVSKCRTDIEDPSAYLEKHQGEQRERTQRFNELMDSLDAETANLLYAVRRIGYLREYRNDIRQEAYLHARELYREIGRRQGLSLSEIIYCTRQEISACLAGDSKLPKSAEIARRRQYTSMYCDNRTITYRWEKEGSGTQDEDLGEVTELKGTVAFKGHIQGRACVILNVAEQAGGFQEGDVLVTTTTNLSFVPLMGKAAAIVTEEGGLLTHTAIVARELKKPCVIGTRIATKILKTGDLIEVDAQQGIVRVLKRS